MAFVPVQCGKCGAKLKVRTGTAMSPAEVRCPKCGKMISVQKDAAPPAPHTVHIPPEVPVPAAAAEASAEPVAAPEPAPESPQPPPLPEPPPLDEPAAEQESPPPVAAPIDEPAAAPEPPPTSSAPVRKASAPIVLSHLGEHPTLGIPVKCAACHWQTNVREELAGKKIRCKLCGGIIPVALSVTPKQATASVLIDAPAAPLTPPKAATVSVPPVADSFSSRPAAVAMPTDSGTAALRAETAGLKARLESASSQAARAERRAQDAEKELHELADQRASENVEASHRIAQLEAQVGSLQALVTELASDCRIELEAAETRATAMRQRLDRLGSLNPSNP